EGIGVDHPLGGPDVDVEVVLDRRQGDVERREVVGDDDDAESHRHQRHHRPRGEAVAVRGPDVDAHGANLSLATSASRGSIYDGGMPVDVETTIVIDRPRADVAAFASDPDNATAWYENIEAIEWKSPRPVEVGSRLGFVA